MYAALEPASQPTTVGTIVTLLQDRHQFKKLSGEVTRKMASEFVYDTLTGALVRESNHTTILDAGLAWYLPTDIEATEEDNDEEMGGEYAGEKGTLSAPFPFLVNLMDKAGEMYEAVARNINALNNKDYHPTKAMEYVATLAVSLHLPRKRDQWVERLLVQTGQANKKQPSSTEPGTDFGGKLLSGTRSWGKMFWQLTLDR